MPIQNIPSLPISKSKPSTGLHFSGSLKKPVFLQLIGCELECLTVREREVFDLMARGMTNKEIAETLVITTNTVKRHLKSIFEKLEVHTRSAAAAKAFSGPLQRLKFRGWATLNPSCFPACVSP